MNHDLSQWKKSIYNNKKIQIKTQWCKWKSSLTKSPPQKFTPNTIQWMWNPFPPPPLDRRETGNMERCSVWGVGPRSNEARRKGTWRLPRSGVGSTRLLDSLNWVLACCPSRAPLSYVGPFSSRHVPTAPLSGVLLVDKDPPWAPVVDDAPLFFPFINIY